MRYLLLLLLFFGIPLEAKRRFTLEERPPPTKTVESSLKTLLYSLDPRSLSQHLAFYELYPDTQEGKLALRAAWALLGRSDSPDASAQELPLSDIQPIIALATRQSFDAPVTLTDPQLLCIELLSQSLANRKLKGHRIESRTEALALCDEETDLARSLLLFQFDVGPEQHRQIRQYEANIDLMALQILARLPSQPSHEEKIRAINQFIFHEMQFRFPPHSLHAADIDLYTFLPSVLDGRQGVCLGVSILYLSLAQRLDLPLEIITPPGHIYVRYNNGSTLINIETTARGIDLPSDVYLGINTRSLQKRKMKEVIALAFMNQAAVFWTREKYKEALALYEKATPFMPHDSQLKLFKGLNSLFTGHHAQGVKLLREVLPLEEAVSTETLAEDYLQGRVDIEGMKAVFLPVDETRDSIISKQHELEAIVKRHPQFRSGLLQLATTWLQLGRTSEARSILERYHRLDPHHCIVEYYLSLLCIERLDYTQGWHYLRQLERLLSQKNHHPKALSAIRKTLLRVYPEP